MINISPWDWFELQIRMRSLESRSEMHTVLYDFDCEDEDCKVICNVFARQTQVMVKEKASREEQLEYYESWIDSEIDAVKSILNRWPELKAYLKPDKDLSVRIMHNYGMGGEVICEHHNGELIWNRNQTTR